MIQFQTFSVSFNGSKTVNDAYRFSLPKSEEFVAAYVRIIPKSGNTRMCDPTIRLEFEGCKIGTNDVNGRVGGGVNKRRCVMGVLQHFLPDFPGVFIVLILGCLL